MVKNEKLDTKINVIQSKDHQLFSIELNKNALTNFNDKRFLIDAINTVAHGSYLIDEFKKI